MVLPRNRRGRSERSIPALATAVMIAAIVYVAGYFGLGDAWRPGPTGLSGRLRMRVFRHEWIAATYAPAARVESWIRGHSVVAGTEHDLFVSSP